MKRDARAFRRGTRPLGMQGGGKRAAELRNCARCGSTLTAPAPRARTRRTAQASR
jgi:hypothetical protein